MPKLANAGGRLVVVLPDGRVDVATSSGGAFSSDPHDAFERWEEFSAWLASASFVADGPALADDELESPVPRPRQIIGVGLSYRDHIRHSGLEVPDRPGYFAKFITALTGPFADVPVPGNGVVTEVELALVVGRGGIRIPESEALSHLAGVTVAQDLTDTLAGVILRRADGSAGPNYVDPAKSNEGFVPLGPYLTTLDEVADLANLDLVLDIDDRPVQRGTTADLAFSIERIISAVSNTVRLLPGDVILTGSSERLEGTRDLRLTPGQVVRARVGELGEQRTRIVAV